MIRCFKAKCSVLTSVSLIDAHVRKFHLASKSLTRSVSHRNQRSEVVEKNIENNSQPLPPENSNVNFFGIESDEGVITLTSKISCLHEKTSTKQLREKFYATSYGVIRYDTDNKLKFHGEFTKRDEFKFPHRSNDFAEVSQNYTNMKPKTSDRLCNDSGKSSLNKEKELKPLKGEAINEVKNKKSSDDCRGVNYIDQFYFESISEDAEKKNPVADSHSSDQLNYFDNEYFGLHNETGIQNLSHGLSENTNFHNNPNVNSDIREYTANSSSLSSLNDDFNFIDKNYSEESDVRKYKSNVKKSFDSGQINAKNSDCDLNMKQLDCKVPKVEEFSQNTIPFNSSSSKGNCQILSFKNSKDNKAAPFNFDENEDGKSVSENKSVNNEFKRELQSNVNKFFDCKQSDGENSDYDLNVKQLESKTLKPENKLNFGSFMGKDSFSNVNYPLSDLKRKTDQDSNLHLHNSESNVIKSIKSTQSETSTNNSSEESTNTDTVRTAYDFVKTLHKQQEALQQNVKEDGNKKPEMKFDSKGFRILKDQVKNLSNFTRDEILCLLKQSILYQDDNLIILNKPYSLVIHDSQTTKSPCLSSFLEDLAREIDGKNFNSKLLTVHRLDKETTGCLLIARNETMAQNLQSLFAQRKIMKKYWVLTSKVPDPPEGLIDMPISEGSVNNKQRMVLHPEIPKDMNYKNHSRKGKQALTSYKVLSEVGNAALVEATPITGIKHQIRVHFGFGLSCPIIGDHKYSHLDKLAPQKLPSDILQRLQVRQSKVRYIPLHIHAKSVTVPGYFENKDLYIQAPLPNHMKENLKKLKFKKK